MQFLLSIRRLGVIAHAEERSFHRQQIGDRLENQPRAELPGSDTKMPERCQSFQEPYAEHRRANGHPLFKRMIALDWSSLVPLESCESSASTSPAHYKSDAIACSMVKRDLKFKTGSKRHVTAKCLQGFISLCCVFR